jgi:hypothetical protein
MGWNHKERCQLAEDVLTEDAVIIYPTIEAYGRDEFVTALGRFHERMPGVHFVKTCGVEQHHGWLRASWRLLQPDGSVGMDGEDVGELNQDGRLRRVLGFHNPLPQLP